MLRFAVCFPWDLSSPQRLGKAVGWCAHCDFFFYNPVPVALKLVWSLGLLHSNERQHQSSLILPDRYSMSASYYFLILLVYFRTHPLAPRAGLPPISFILKMTLVLFIFIPFDSIVPYLIPTAFRKLFLTLTVKTLGEIALLISLFLH